MRYLAFGITWLVLGFVFAWMFGNAKRLGGRKHLALLMLLLFTTPAMASPVVTVSEPSPKQAYEQRWERNVRYCAWRVSQYTQRPVVYQIGVYGAIPRYTTDRQERLLVACIETVTAVRPLTAEEYAMLGWPDLTPVSRGIGPDAFRFIPEGQ